MRRLSSVLFVAVLLMGSACYGYFYDSFDPNVYFPEPIMGERSVTIDVDGDLSDWAGAQWVPLDALYYSDTGYDPCDLSGCEYAVCWDTNAIYVAVKVVDTYHVLGETAGSWNTQDRVEIFVDAANNDTANYNGSMASAQHYVMGATPTGGTWIQLGDATSPPAIPGSPETLYASDVNGDVITYEIRVPSWSNMTTTTLANLAVNDIIGVDVVVGTKSADGYGMLSNDTRRPEKHLYAANFQDWKLSSDAWGDITNVLNAAQIVGKNGWQQAYSGAYGTLLQAEANLIGQALEPVDNWGLTPYAGWSGAGRNITLDVIDGDYELTMAVYGQAHTGTTMDQKFFEIGDLPLLTGDTTSANSYIIMLDDRNTVNYLYLFTIRDGARNVAEDVDGGAFDGATYKWFEFKFVVDMDAGTASAYWRDVDDVTKQPIGGGGWTLIGNFPGPIPFDTLNAFVFALNDYARIDNVTSGFEGEDRVPEDCSVVIQAGYGLGNDFNSDCAVGLPDLAVLSADWLRCVEPGEAGCETPWWD
ncbi:MAG: hypothetical protein JW936_02055 [Sedimentisphaerales bacterium]|nr:hypothetical protein [Sedimentisphaerales bacterium]